MRHSRHHDYDPGQRWVLTCLSTIAHLSLVINVVTETFTGEHLRTSSTLLTSMFSADMTASVICWSVLLSKRMTSKKHGPYSNNSKNWSTKAREITRAIRLTQLTMMSLTRIYSLTKTLALTSAPAASRVVTRRKLFILTACCKMWCGWLPSLYNAMKRCLLFRSHTDKKECKILTRHSWPVACSWHHTLTPCQQRSPMLHNCIPTLRRLPAKSIIILILLAYRSLQHASSSLINHDLDLPGNISPCRS